MNELIKARWNQRGNFFKDSLQGVLYATFPESLNEIIHSWQLSVLVKYFPSEKINASVLDVGCGYGRLSLPLSRIFKDSTFFGIDISKDYVGLYNKNLAKRGKAVVGDIAKITHSRKYDFIFIVTVLMYLNNAQIEVLSHKFRSALNRGGKLVVIENNKSGTDYVGGFGLANLFKNIFRKKNNYAIPHKIFSDYDILSPFSRYFKLIAKENSSSLTVFIPFLLVFSKFFGINFKPFLPNRSLPFLPSLYRAYIFTYERQ